MNPDRAWDRLIVSFGNLARPVIPEWLSRALAKYLEPINHQILPHRQHHFPVYPELWLPIQNQLGSIASIEIRQAAIHLWFCEAAKHHCRIGSLVVSKHNDRWAASFFCLTRSVFAILENEHQAREFLHWLTVSPQNCERLMNLETPTTNLWVASIDGQAAELYARELKYVEVSIGDHANSESIPSSRLISGSFAPVHRGHLKMAEYAVKETVAPVVFELPVFNAAKPPLDHFEVIHRLKQSFSADEQKPTVILSNASTFEQKSNLYPGTTFLVGVDTLLRIGDPAYYNGVDGLHQAIRQIVDNNCRFLVYGREVMIDGTQAFQTGHAFDLPAELIRICSLLPEESFREDVSSTAQRVQHFE